MNDDDCGEPRATLSDIDRLGDEWGFTLYDHEEREIAAFAFDSENNARQAHKAMTMVVDLAIAVSPAEATTVPMGFMPVPIVKA